MADDVTPPASESDLPEPGASPFFEGAEEPSGESDAAEPPAEGATPAEQPEPAEAAGEVDLGNTSPYTPVFEEGEFDPATSQPTQLLAPVEAEPEPFPPFDPAAAQETQLVPVVPEQEAMLPAMPGNDQAPVIAASVPTVIAGSRVVIVVSRGPSEIPPAAMVGVPHVTGLSQGDALSQLQQTGLSAQVFNEYSDLARGEVVGQLPAYGQSAPTGSEAVLLVSAGPPPTPALSVPLPDVVGLTEADALARVQNAGLSPQVVRDFSPNVPLGVVMEQLPNGHALAEVPHRQSSLWWLWVLLGLAIAFAVSGGVYYWLNRTGTVPNVVGLSQSQAEQAITAAGFKLGSLGTTQTISASDIGKVTTQTPAPNSELRLIDQVDIVVSGGQALFSVPNVTSKPLTEAQSILTSAGLQVSTSQAYSSTVPKDAVISQSPAAGERIPSGTTIGLTVSLGQQNVTVPGVQSQTRTQAQSTLKAAGLTSQVVVDYWFNGIKDAVVAQYPTAGMSVVPGTIIGLIVAKDTPSSSVSTATVPTVVGKKQADAQKALSNAGLSNTIISAPGGGQAKGVVTGQVPEANTQMPKKGAVIIIVSNGK